MVSVKEIKAPLKLVSTLQFLSEDGETCALRDVVDFEHDQLNSFHNVTSSILCLLSHIVSSLKKASFFSVFVSVSDIAIREMVMKIVR
jgi:hypothetical protein